MVAAEDTVGAFEEVTVDMGSTDNDSLTSLLEACPDGQLISALPALLRALPADALDRCLIVVREALTEELEGGSLDSDEASIGSWRAALCGPGSGVAESEPLEASIRSEVGQTSAATQDGNSSNTAKVAEKRPFRAMAAPFGVAVPASKKSKDAVSEHEEKPEAAAPRSLYVANVPYDATEDDIKIWFQNQLSSVGNVQSVRLLVGHDGNSKGAAIIAFDTAEAAEKILQLDGQPGLEERRLIVKVDRLASKGDKAAGKGRLKRGKGEKDDSKGKSAGKGEKKGESKGQKGGSADPEQEAKCVVLKNLAFNATEANIGELFAGVGEVAAVRIKRDKGSGKSKGFAVVEFTSKDAIPEAVKRSGQVVRGRGVRVEAMGAAPDPTPEKNDNSCASSATKETENVEKDENHAVVEAPTAEVAASLVDSSVDDAAKVKEAPSSEATNGAAQESEADALRKHAQQMLASSSQAAEPPKKRSRGEKTSQCGESAEVFPEGEHGLKAVAELLSAHSTADALLAAEGAESLKGRLAALGLKSGGPPLERAQRLLRLQGLTSIEGLPSDLLNKSSRKSERGRIISVSSEPIKFVKAGAVEEDEKIVADKAADAETTATVTRRGVEMCD